MVKTLGWQLRSSLLLHHYVKTVGKLLTLLPLSSRNVLICHQPKCGHALKVTGGKQCQLVVLTEQKPGSGPRAFIKCGILAYSN